MRLVYGVIDNQETVKNTILWCTYRRGIPGIGSDKGWGCMIRVAQMFHAHILHRLEHGSSWPIKRLTTSTRSKFEDDSNSDCSFQCFCASALGRGVPVGSWMGPATAVRVVGDMLRRALTLSVFDNRIVYLDELPPAPFVACFPMRLGTGRYALNKYESDLFRYMNWPQFAGILGGKPRHAIYFVGYEDTSAKSLLGVDPHDVHDVGEELPVPNLKKVPYSCIDPSIVLCFFCKREDEKEDLLRRLANDVLISVSQTRPSYDQCLTMPIED